MELNNADAERPNLSRNGRMKKRYVQQTGLIDYAGTWLSRFPNISKECPLPQHPAQGDGRQLPSALKEACGGMWPDEAHLELKNW